MALQERVSAQRCMSGHRCSDGAATVQDAAPPEGFCECHTHTSEGACFGAVSPQRSAVGEWLHTSRAVNKNPRYRPFMLPSRRRVGRRRLENNVRPELLKFLVSPADAKKKNV
ncbi:hypothetical protein C8Q70DRAFT_351982 [Cubamyces menziesii]|nr:hypothetical protein C8Q70DRAFT_351982 [Cubamyces menziesii]